MLIAGSPSAQVYAVRNPGAEGLTAVTEMGGVIFPPLPAFYHRPRTIEQMVGDSVERRSTIVDVSTKQGRSGALVFVRVRHELHCNGAADPALTEFHDIVYRDARRPGDAEPPPQRADGGAPWQREIVADDVLLFRYSALTFNGHRIHYDRRYVTEVEGYPGLIVHGPLIATLLMDLLRRQAPDAAVTAFSFKAVRPTFDGHPLRVNGLPAADGFDDDMGDATLIGP